MQPRKRDRGFETAEQAAERGKFDLALVAALSDAGLRRSEASSLTWGDVQRWDDGSGLITVVRSKTDVEAAGAVVAITPAAMQALYAMRPAVVASSEKLRALGIADRPAGEGDRQSRRIGGLGVLQRAQRAGGHGRPLHPRRISRVGTAVSVMPTRSVFSRTRTHRKQFQPTAMIHKCIPSGEAGKPRHPRGDRVVQSPAEYDLISQR